MIRGTLTICLLALFCACGSANNIGGEDYGNIAAGPMGITLTQAEHPYGWSRADCYECHNDFNIHQEDRTGTGINLDAIRTMTENQGLASCATCHGTNGVQ